MIKQGYIEIIDQRMIFVYYESKKPNVLDYTLGLDSVGYLMDCEIYEASKRSVEVNGVLQVKDKWVFEDKILHHLLDEGNITDNQPCKAEVTNNKATIIELL